MRILTISGSLRAASSNTSVLEALALLAPPGVAVTRYEGLGALPHFNPDIEMEALPEAVARLRRQVAEADGLIVSSPEYAHGIAGSFKNGLDWLVAAWIFRASRWRRSMRRRAPATPRRNWRKSSGRCRRD